MNRTAAIAILAACAALPVVAAVVLLRSDGPPPNEAAFNMAEAFQLTMRDTYRSTGQLDRVKEIDDRVMRLRLGDTEALAEVITLAEYRAIQIRRVADQSPSANGHLYNQIDALKDDIEVMRGGL